MMYQSGFSREAEPKGVYMMYTYMYTHILTYIHTYTHVYMESIHMEKEIYVKQLAHMTVKAFKYKIFRIMS